MTFDQAIAKYYSEGKFKTLVELERPELQLVKREIQERYDREIPRS